MTREASAGPLVTLSCVADRRTPFDNAGEREMLVEFLDYLRESVVLKASGLDPAAAMQPRVASGTSLLGLVKHLTMVEVAEGNGCVTTPVCGEPVHLVNTRRTRRR